MKPSFLIRVLVVTASAFLAAGPARPESNPMAQGDGWYLAGQYNLAAGFYSEACLQDPFDAEAFYRWGLCLYRQGNVKDARSCFGRALLLKPGHQNARRMLERSGGHPSEQKSSAHLEAGVERFRAGRYHSAALEFTRALMENPTSVAAHFNLAVTHYKLGRYQDSTREIRQCLSINPRHVGARYLSVALERAKGDTKSAKAQLREWEAWNPGETLIQEAQRRLALVEIAETKALWRGSVQVLTGYNRGESGTPGSPATLRGLSQECYAQLSCDPWGRRRAFQLSGGLGAALRATNGEPLRDFHNNLGIAWSRPIRPKVSLGAGADFQQSFESGSRRYWRDQATLAAQWTGRALDGARLEAQVLREGYPGFTEMDATSWVASCGGQESLSGDVDAFFSYAFRKNDARESVNDYVSHGAVLGARKAGMNTWGFDAYAQVLFVTYPRGSAIPADSARNDESLNVYVGYRRPLGGKRYLLMGDNWTCESTGSPASTLKSNKASVGLLWYF